MKWLYKLHKMINTKKYQSLSANDIFHIAWRDSILDNKLAKGLERTSQTKYRVPTNGQGNK